MFQNISIDIASFPGGAIVNSLGQGENVVIPGRIFDSILNASANPEDVLRDAKRTWSKYPFGEVFVTDSYGLPCKKIIHVITPLKFMDPKNEMIAEVYKKVLQTALDNGIKTISVPIIGTGANGYVTGTVASIARRICFQFAQEHPEIDVYLNIYTLESGYEEEERAHRRYVREYRKPSSATGPARHSVPNMLSAETDGPRREIEPKKPLMKRIGVIRGDSFANMIRKYVFAKNITKSQKVKEDRLESAWAEINSLVLGIKQDPKTFQETLNDIIKAKEAGVPSQYEKERGKTSHSVQYDWKKQKNRNGKGYHWECPNKAEILLTCVALHLTAEEAVEVYSFCDYSLNEYDDYGNAFNECVKKLRRGSDGTDILRTYHFWAGESIFEYKENRRKVRAYGPERW